MTYDDYDKEYYYHRAEAEIEAAQRSRSTPAVKAHVEMAERYLDLCSDYVPDAEADQEPADQDGAEQDQAEQDRAEPA